MTLPKIIDGKIDGFDVIFKSLSPETHLVITVDKDDPEFTLWEMHTVEDISIVHDEMLVKRIIALASSNPKTKDGWYACDGAMVYDDGGLERIVEYDEKENRWQSVGYGWPVDVSQCTVYPKEKQ